MDSMDVWHRSTFSSDFITSDYDAYSSIIFKKRSPVLTFTDGVDKRFTFCGRGFLSTAKQFKTYLQILQKNCNPAVARFRTFFKKNNI